MVFQVDACYIIAIRKKQEFSLRSILIIYNNIRIREGIKMSKKFPINFKKSNNNLSIKKEEKDIIIDVIK